MHHLCHRPVRRSIFRGGWLSVLLTVAVTGSAQATTAEQVVNTGPTDLAASTTYTPGGAGVPGPTSDVLFNSASYTTTTFGMATATAIDIGTLNDHSAGVPLTIDDLGGPKTINIHGGTNNALPGTIATNDLIYSGAGASLTVQPSVSIAINASGIIEASNPGSSLTLNDTTTLSSASTVQFVNSAPGGTTSMTGTLTNAGALTFTAAAGAIAVSGTFNNTGNVTFNGGPGSVTVTGPFNNSGVASFSGAIGVAVAAPINNTGGSLVFAAASSGVMSPSTTITSSGSSAMIMTGTTQTIDSYTLTGTGINKIDMAGGSSSLTVHTSISLGTGTLNILNWTGSSVTGAFGVPGDTPLIVGLTTTISPADLANILWSNLTVDGTFYTTFTGAQLITDPAGYYEITPDTIPAPEPTTIFASLGLLGLLAWRGRRRMTGPRGGVLQALSFIW